MILKSSPFSYTFILLRVSNIWALLLRLQAFHFSIDWARGNDDGGDDDAVLFYWLGPKGVCRHIRKDIHECFTVDGAPVTMEEGKSGGGLYAILIYSREVQINQQICFRKIGNATGLLKLNCRNLFAHSVYVSCLRLVLQERFPAGVYLVNKGEGKAANSVSAKRSQGGR